MKPLANPDEPSKHVGKCQPAKDRVQFAIEVSTTTSPCCSPGKFDPHPIQPYDLTSELYCNIKFRSKLWDHGSEERAVPRVTATFPSFVLAWKTPWYFSSSVTLDGPRSFSTRSFIAVGGDDESCTKSAVTVPEKVRRFAMKFGRKGGPLLGEFNVTLTVKLLKQDVGRETRHWILGHEPITSVDFKIRRKIRLRVIEERDVSSKRSIKMNQLHANENEKNTYA